MSVHAQNPASEPVSATQEFRLLLKWVSSINLPSCIEVTNFNILQQGVALNDISSLILNCPLNEKIYRHELDSEFKIEHNFKHLLKALKPVLPSHLSLLKANELVGSYEKMLVLLRWMVKVLDFPFYKVIKSSFHKFYSKGVKNQRDVERLEKEKEKSIGNMLKSTEKRIRKPEFKEYKGPWCVGDVDFYEFLKEIRVFNGKSQEELLALCTSGEVFADFINVLEGKHERVKGIVRKPLCRSYKVANVAKVLKFLKAYPKMRSTFLWSDEDILDGDLDTIKGLLYDILVLYRKVPGKDRQALVRKIEFKSPSVQENSPLLMTKQLTQSVGLLSGRNVKESKMSKFSVQTKNSIESSIKLASPREYTEFLDDYPDFSWNSTENLQEKINEWLTSIELGHYIVPISSELLSDNLRNGVILCELASLLCNKRPLIKHKAPKSLNQVYDNIETAFQVFREDNKIPLSLISNPKLITLDTNQSIWSLLSHIMLSYPRLSTKKAKHSLPNLPYNPSEIDCLQRSLFSFILSKGIIDQLSQSKPPKSFQDLLRGLVSGVLLSDLVGQVLRRPISGIFRVQVSERLALSNIQKSLIPLRNLRSMGQQYVFSEQGIAKGDLGVILGLLEDLHRFSDHMPPRQRGEQYHSDGPYLPKTRLPGKRLSFDTFNDLNSSRLSRPLSPSSPLSPLSPFSPSSPPSHLPTAQRLLSTSQSDKGLISKSLNQTPLLTFDESFKGFEWLKFIGVEFKNGVDLNRDLLWEFSSGELLAEIVGRLEGKKILTGGRKGLVQAACLHNLAKVFEVLRNKPTFPSYLCFCEEEVFKGDGVVIREVLKEIYRIYRRTISNMKTFHSKKVVVD